MRPQNRGGSTRRRLSLWLCLNLVIFVACYLNYRLQLKHRYLYKTLNAGLCFSRAAAMVINFNLLLVWLPMCKYTLTRLACLANGSLRHQRQLYLEAEASLERGSGSFDLAPAATMVAASSKTIGRSSSPPKKVARLVAKLRCAIEGAIGRFRLWLCLAKMNSINSFLIAVDHCTSLHTICATTITIAAVIHTAAHLVNVINFSNNFDPLLGELNMAEYKGQSPLQLLVSGSLMIMILILMSLSSVHIIRNSSYDLFQIFHRLSVVFVLLLFLHPFSHVLKEQSNVGRHHPELCYDRMMTALNSSSSSSSSSSPPLLALTPTVTAAASGRALPLRAGGSGRAASSQEQQANGQGRFQFSHADPLPAPSSSSGGGAERAEEKADLAFQGHHGQQEQQQQPANGRSNATRQQRAAASGAHDLNNNMTIRDNQNTVIGQPLTGRNNSSNTTSGSNVSRPQGQLFRLNNAATGQQQQRLQSAANSSAAAQVVVSASPTAAGSICLDLRPLFVAQSSICWYVLSMGLSCYLLDLLLRKRRRSRSSIQLLDVSLDREGNLIELILCNNHRRFSHWLPGQFVYLNCPQIAAYEWHPFTISSMDNMTRRFTLHIKTGGDWTRKLRHRLEQQAAAIVGRDDSMPLPSPPPLLCPTSAAASKFSLEVARNQFNAAGRGCRATNTTDGIIVNGPILAHLDRPILPNSDCYNHKTGRLEVKCTKLVRVRHEHLDGDDEAGDAFDGASDAGQFGQQQQQFYSICQQHGYHQPAGSKSQQLDLFIDGPFHSPFERLLEQQVSVCIANGVGWTAFSSVFQCITNSSSSSNNNNHSDALDSKKAAEQMAANSNTQDWWTQWRNFVVKVDDDLPADGEQKKQTDHSSSAAVAAAANKLGTVPLQPATANSSSSSSGIRKLSDTKLHLMIIVTSIEQLKPFYTLARDYFARIQQHQQMSASSNQVDQTQQLSPIREITAFITRCQEDETVEQFCRQENLATVATLGQQTSRAIKVNDVFTIHFGKPAFDLYLDAFSALYSDRQKISVYCCGSYQVKKTVQEICRSLNKGNAHTGAALGNEMIRPFYSYHEENF